METTQAISPKEAIRLMADAALAQQADADDSNGVVRAIVSAHNLGFYAWFCVCCEIADRGAQREGFKNQADRAASKCKQA